MNIRLSWLRFGLVRLLERQLSVQSLYRILRPVAIVHAAFPLFRRRAPPLPLPGCLATGKPSIASAAGRSATYLNRTLHYFPEQLSSAKWRSRCRIAGLGPLQEARRRGRPVVLAFCHLGPCFLLAHWLRAAGFPASGLVDGSSRSDSRHRCLNAQLRPLINESILFFLDQLRKASDYLVDGNCLVIALDSNVGRQICVPVRDGWVFQMAAGAIRLAARHQAELIPCSIVDEGQWQFRIELGRPVPREFLTSETGWASAGRHLLEEILPHLQAWPEQWSPTLARSFRTPDSTHPAKFPAGTNFPTPALERHSSHEENMPGHRRRSRLSGIPAGAGWEF